MQLPQKHMDLTAPQAIPEPRTSNCGLQEGNSMAGLRRAISSADLQETQPGKTLQNTSDLQRVWVWWAHYYSSQVFAGQKGFLQLAWPQDRWWEAHCSTEIREILKKAVTKGEEDY